MVTLRAVIYLTCPSLECLERSQQHIRRRGYRQVGVVHDAGHERWVDVLMAAVRGEYEVIVRCCDNYVPDRIPRVEVADRGATPHPGPAQRRRRPRRS